MRLTDFVCSNVIFAAAHSLLFLKPESELNPKQINFFVPILIKQKLLLWTTKDREILGPQDVLIWSKIKVLGTSESGVLRISFENDAGT